MSEHGIMQPNPALLYDLEVRRKLKSQPVIAHDLGAGQKCIKCGPTCPGFQLHFWRYIKFELNKNSYNLGKSSSIIIDTLFQ